MSRLLVSLLALALASGAHAQSVEVEIDLAGRDLGGTTVGIRGDTAPLSWDRSTPLADPDGDGVYSVEIPFPAGTGTVAYKAVIQPASGEPTWEPGSNRLLFPGRMTVDRRAFGGPQTGLPVLTLSRAELAEDLTLLQQAMQALHPGLTLHNTEADLQGIVDRLMRDARALGERHGEAIPMPAAYLPIARAVASIQDGHTQVSMYNQGGYLDALLYTRPDRVPFTFRLVAGRMIVTADATPGGVLPPGTEVLTLDGRPVREVIEAMMPYASADGGNDAKRLHELQVDGLPAPAERFDVLYSLLYEPDGALGLTVRSPDGVVSDLSVPRLSQDARRAALLAQDPTRPQSNDDLLQFRFLDDGTAYLKVGSFATFNMDRDYDAWLTDAFRQMAAAGSERLVVDLRGCAGGMDAAAALLLRHLITEPTEISFWQGFTAYDRVPDALRSSIGSWSTDFYDLSARVTPVGDGTFRMPTRAPIQLPPATNAFQGRAAVLVDVAASSATFYLARTLKETGAAPLVGQVTGGSLKGLNAGQIAFLTLPNTGIVVDVPLFANRPLTPGPDRGVTPDVLVAPDAEAVIAGRDPELEAAIRLLVEPALDGSEEPSDRPISTLPLGDLSGSWTGTLTYADYQDDLSETILTVTAEGVTLAGGVRLVVMFVEPDGSSGGTGTTEISNLPDSPDQLGYDGDRWSVVERVLRDDGGFRVVIETEGADNNRPATIRHTISLEGGVLTDRKEVRYDGTEGFFQRNLFRLVRP